MEKFFEGMNQALSTPVGVFGAVLCLVVICFIELESVLKQYKKEK